MRAAAYAKAIGRGAAFSLAAYRQVFAAGRELGDPETVLIAAAACEMHPAAVLKAIESRSVARALDEATERAAANGVRRLPAVRLGARVFERDGGIDQAAATLLASG
jgi:2-hydroxychromene-2-carboxylate isomerase